MKVTIECTHETPVAVMSLLFAAILQGKEMIEATGVQNTGVTAPAAPVVNMPVSKGTKVTAKEPEVNANTAAPTQGPAEITDEDIRKVCAEKKEANKTDAIKALIKSYDVKSATAVPAEKRAEFMEKLKAL